MLPTGVKLCIERELAANKFKIEVKKHGLFCGFLTGYLNVRSGVMKCYPKRLAPGTFRESELPIEVRYDEVSWVRQRHAQ